MKLSLPRRSLMLIALGSFQLLPATAQEVPPRTFAGQALEVPEDQLDAGMVYHLQPGVDTQLAITSDAPLQRLVITANQGIGYLLTPFDLEDGAPPLLAGAVRVPVVGLRTGLEQIDPFLRSSRLLKAEEQPEITILLGKLNRFKATQVSPEKTSYNLNLTVLVSLAGARHETVMDAELTILPSSRLTMARNVGDLAILRTALEIKASAWGIAIPPQWAQRISDDLHLDAFFVFNTISPDRSGDPRDDPAIYAKQLHFRTLLEDLQQVEEAYRYARDLRIEIWDNPKELTRLANAMTGTQEADARDLGFARTLATRAVEVSGQEDPQSLAALARIEAAAGRLEEAVSWQEKAVAAAPEGRLKQGLTRRLQELKQKESRN